MGRGFRILSDRSGTVRESQSPLVKFRNKAFTGGTSLLPEALFNADSLRKAQHPVIFLRCHCAIECFNICHLRKRCILIHNANIDMISVSLMEIAQDFLESFVCPGSSRWRTIIPCCINPVSSSMTGSPTWRYISEMAAQAVSK